MATIQDVAKRAHVGAATVSRVLSGNGYVKEETKEKVLKAIEELQYTPNEMARNLFFRKSGIVAVIVPQVDNPFFAELVNAAEIALAQKGYQMMLCNTWREHNYEKRYLELLKQQKVDGIIFGSHSLDTDQYIGIDRPIVALDRRIGDQVPCVMSDHAEGGRLAAQALLNLGCRKILQFRGVTTVSTPSNIRHKVFENVVASGGAEIFDYVMDWNIFDYAYYTGLTENLFERYPDIDGIFGADSVAMAAINRALASGRRVPEDVKIIGYDGASVTNLAYPTLTTICQPINDLANTCVNVMLDLIQGKKPESMSIVLPVTIRYGASAPEK